MKNFAISTLAVAIALTNSLANSLSVSAATIRLYEPGEGLTPDTSTADSGPWLTSGGLLGGGIQASLGTSGTNLNTNGNSNVDNSIVAGYSNRGANFLTNPVTPGAFVNTAFPSLNRSTGYTLKFTVAVLSESREILIPSSFNGATTSGIKGIPERAGFSVLALSSDAQGIEIGFQDNVEVGTVFAQNFDFTQGESATVSRNDILRASTNYELAILGSNYSLSADNTEILTGTLRSYNASLLLNPYQTPDFIFLGDDSREARANIILGNVSLTTTPVPFEFSPVLGLVAVGAWAIAKQVKAKKSKK